MNRKKRIRYAAEILVITYERELWNWTPEELKLDEAPEALLAVAALKATELLSVTLPEMTVADWTAAGTRAALSYPTLIRDAQAERSANLQA